MASKSLALGAAIIGLLLLGIVSGHHQPNHQGPHMCDANGASSEECFNRARYSIVLRTEQSDQKVRFFLYKNNNAHIESAEIIPHDLESIHKANPFLDQDAEWKFLIPGFPSTGKSPFPENVRDAYLWRMINHPTERYNIIIVDWDRSIMCKKDAYAATNNFTSTVLAAGQQLAEMLIFLNEKEQLSLSKNAHMIGFSMGAQVADEAARFVKKHFNKTKIIYRLTALEPVDTKFWANRAVTNIPHPRPIIERSFVVYQDTYHTSNRYGTTMQIGDLDFFVNSGTRQPGCKPGLFERSDITLFQDLCDHFYVTALFAESINDEDKKSMTGCMGCIDLEDFKTGKCKPANCEDSPLLGEFADREVVDRQPFAVGRAYIRTGDLHNFGTRFEKTLIDAGEPKRDHYGWRQLC